MSRDELPIVRARSWAEIDADATRLLRQFYPDRENDPGPVPIDHFVEFVLPRNFAVDFEVTHLPHPSEAITTPGNANNPPAIYMSSTVYDLLIAGNARARFTAAHEAYHGYRHAWELRTALVSGTHHGLHRKTNAIPAYRNPERQADVFASRFLMPAAAVRAAFQTLGPNVPALARTFQVSERAMSLRLGELGLR